CATGHPADLRWFGGGDADAGLPRSERHADVELAGYSGAGAAGPVPADPRDGAEPGPGDADEPAAAGPATAAVPCAAADIREPGGTLISGLRLAFAPNRREHNQTREMQAANGLHLAISILRLFVSGE